MKNFMVAVVALVGVILFFIMPHTKISVSAENATDNSVIVEKTVQEFVENYDFSELETFLESEDINLFNNKPIKDVIKELIVSGAGVNISDILRLVLNSFVGEIETVLKLVALIVAIVGFGGFSEMLKGSSNNSGISGIINYFLLTIILVVVTTIISGFVADTTAILNKLKAIMEIIFPILLSLLVTVGGTRASLAIQPSVVVLTSVVFEVIIVLSTTIITILLVLSVVGELTDNIKLDKLKGFVGSLYKWALGLVFTIFMAHLTLSGIMAGGADNVSIKTAKYAIKSYIPLVGGYVSDSYEIFRMGSVLLKNSLGMVGVVILFGLVIGKIMSLIVYNLGFKLASGLSEPMGMPKISRFLSSLASIFNFLIASIAACFLLGVLTIVIIMSSANTIF